MAWMLSYDPETHRRCIACEPVGGQYPLRRIDIPEVNSPWPSGAPTLECGHVDVCLADFQAGHKDWWIPDPPKQEDVVVTTPEGKEIVAEVFRETNGQWQLVITTPDGDFERTARHPGALVDQAELWAFSRGMKIEVRFLTKVGQYP